MLNADLLALSSSKSRPTGAQSPPGPAGMASMAGMAGAAGIAGSPGPPGQLPSPPGSGPNDVPALENEQVKTYNMEKLKAQSSSGHAFLIKLLEVVLDMEEKNIAAENDDVLTISQSAFSPKEQKQQITNYRLHAARAMVVDEIQGILIAQEWDNTKRMETYLPREFMTPFISFRRELHAWRWS